MPELMTKNLGLVDASRRGKKAWIRMSGAMVFTSKCFRIASAGVSSAVVTRSRSPALEMRTSTLVMPWDLSSLTASVGSVADVESILTVMILLPAPSFTVLKTCLADSTLRTAAMTVVWGRAAKTPRRPLPMPRLAPVIRYVSPDISQDMSFEVGGVFDGEVENSFDETCCSSSWFVVMIACLL